MLRRWLLSLALVSILIVIQSTWLEYIALYSVIPDLSLLAIVYISFKSPGLQGQSLGFIAGLLQDGISAAPFGLNSLIKTSIAWLANLLSGKFYIDKFLMPALFGSVATLVKALNLTILATIFPGNILTYDLLSSVLWIEVAYNAVLAPVLFLFLSPLDRFLIPMEKR